MLTGSSAGGVCCWLVAWLGMVLRAGLLMIPMASMAGDGEAAWVHVDPTGRVSLEDVVSGRARLTQGLEASPIYKLGPGGVLWLRYAVPPQARSGSPWRLEVPLPQLDDITFHQRDASRAWVRQWAGDKVPVDRWSQPGRYPSFRLASGAAEPVIYLRIRHDRPFTIPVAFVSETEHVQQLGRDYMLTGLLMGVMVLLAIACASYGAFYRDRAYAWYAVQVLVMGLSVATYGGVAAHLLWPSAAGWADAANGSLALLAAALTLIVVRELSGVAAHHRRLAQLTAAAGVAGLLLAVAHPVLDRTLSVGLTSGYFVLGIVLNVLMAWQAGRRGDAVGRWLLAAYLPPSVAVVIVLLRVNGWVPAVWDTQGPLMLSMLIQGPMLLAALHLRTRGRHHLQMRTQSLVSQDPLTGLMPETWFHDRLDHAVRRVRAHGDNVGLLLVEVANLSQLRASQGATGAERALLRAAIKLRGLANDVDTVARHGDARFALLLEGHGQRDSVLALAQRIVAAGLRQSSPASTEPPLRFQIAACLLREQTDSGADVILSLGEVLDELSRRSRRTIRFLDADATLAMAMGDDDDPSAVDDATQPWMERNE